MGEEGECKAIGTTRKGDCYMWGSRKRAKRVHAMREMLRQCYLHCRLVRASSALTTVRAADSVYFEIT